MFSGMSLHEGIDEFSSLQHVNLKDINCLLKKAKRHVFSTVLQWQYILREPVSVPPDDVTHCWILAADSAVPIHGRPGIPSHVTKTSEFQLACWEAQIFANKYHNPDNHCIS